MRSYASAANGSLLSAWSARPRISGRSTDTDVQHELRVKDHRIGLRHTYGASLDCHPFDRCAAGFGRRRCLLNRDRRVHGHIKSAVVALEYGRAGGHFRRPSRLCLPFPREFALAQTPTFSAGNSSARAEHTPGFRPVSRSKEGVAVRRPRVFFTSRYRPAAGPIQTAKVAKRIAIKAR